MDTVCAIQGQSWLAGLPPSHQNQLMLRRCLKLGSVVLSLLCAAGCVSSGGQSGTEALDVKGQDASADPTTTPSNGSSEEDAGATEDEGTTDEPVVIPEGSFKLFVDYYQTPCPEPDGAPFCLRFAEVEGEYQLDPAVTWPDYEWGHYYELAAHWEATDGADGGTAQRLVVDGILKDEIKAGQIFTLRIDPTLDTAGYTPQVNYDVPTAMSSLETGPSFDCAGDACGSLSGVMGKNQVFNARFEIGEDGQLTLVNVEISADDSSALGQYLNELKNTWESSEPEQYVVKVCGTGFSPPSCTLAVINGDEIVSAELESIAGVWAPTDLGASDPLWLMFDEAQAAAELEVDPTYGYISSYLQRSISESWGKEVSCFVVDTQDPEQCRDAI